MRKGLMVLSTLLMVGLATGAFASVFTNSLQDLVNEKNAAISGTPNPPETAVGGDNIGSAVLIGGLPYSDAGNTCGFTNDYDYACPYTGSTSGDVVYKYLPTSAQQITVDLCNSGYDTKVYIYENTVGNVVACNDDACNDPSGNPWRSLVTCVSVTPGNTYYIVVDGYGGDCGAYNMNVSLSVGCPEPCVPENCPPGALVEGEPLCGPNYVDAWNGGCNSIPNVFSVLPCLASVTVCGQGGNYTFNGLSYRDTDWYEVVLPVAGNVTATLCAEFDSQLAGIDGNIGCGFITITCGSVFGTPNTTISCTWAAPAGKVWVFVATSAFSGVPCGSSYYLTVNTPCAGNAVENTSWGSVKGLYR